MNWERGHNYSHWRRKPEKKLEGSYMGFHRPTRVVPPSSSSPSNSTFSPGKWFLHGVPQANQGGSSQLTPPPAIQHSPQVNDSYMGFHRPTRMVLPSSFFPGNSIFFKVNGSYMGFHRPTRMVPSSSSSPILPQQFNIIPR
jgi:hypothetical protein